jgi:hypothetical protein
VAKLPQKEQEKYLQIAVEKQLSVASLKALIKNDDGEEKPNSKVEVYELALKSIVKQVGDSPYFCAELFGNKLEDETKVPAGNLFCTKLAVTAADALKAFAK